MLPLRQGILSRGSFCPYTPLSQESAFWFTLPLSEGEIKSQKNNKIGGIYPLDKPQRIE
jgi:hypothetical protein